MSATVEEVMCEPGAQPADCKDCGPRARRLRVCRELPVVTVGLLAARNSEETWKSAEMPEVRDEEIDISYQKNQVSGVLSLLTLL